MIDDIIRKKEIEGLSWSKIAAQTGLSKGQVRGLYQRNRYRPRVESLTTPPGGGYRPAGRKSVSHPAGWEPGFRLEHGKGEVASGPVAEGQAPDWGFVMRELNLDPDLYEVIEPINVRSWDANVGDGEIKRLWYYKANVRQRQTAGDKVDIEELKTQIATHLPYRKDPDKSEPSYAFTLVLTDWQLAKRDGDGTKGIIERALIAFDSAAYRLEELRAMGRKIGPIYMPDLGDLMEGCDGHYAMQTFEVEMDRRTQAKVARRLLLHGINRLAPLTERLVIPVTASNHGEHRKNGKLFTTWGDNEDVAVAEQVAEILEANPQAYGHVNFVIADQDLDLTLDVCGTITTFAHGHQMKQGVEAWWKGQALGRQSAMDSTLLITGHRHHLEVVDYGARTSIIAPSLESDSAWFRNATGTPGRPGVLSLLIGQGHWSDLQVL